MILEESSKSVDMINITMDLTDYEFKLYIQPLIDTYKLDVNLKYWESMKWNSYRHNWTWTTEEYSFYFSYSSNLGQDYNDRFRLSYNPNKVLNEDKVLSYLLNIFRLNRINIQSVDVAFDYMGVTTSELTFDKGRKREWKIHKYQDSDLTYYLGKSGTNGHIKVYDKASEENKGKKVSYNKTRYEVTVLVNEDVKHIDKWECKTELPALYIQGEINDKSLKPTDRLLVFSIRNGYPMDSLTYEQRKRYKKIMENVDYQYTKIKPSQLAVEKVLKKFINDLFN